ncbi:MAG: histidine kinase [Nostoc sp.]|uniref:histidine kinase n=1 Tax=Nostoc sp. TaxID=1180 RepID=UPI002FF77DD1
MVVGVHKRGVGVFSHRRDVEHALHELKKVGFDMNRVSVITQDGDKDDIAGAEVRDRVGDKSDEGAKVGAATGGALGGLTGLLVGLGTLAIPGLGPIMLAGAAATTLATTLAGAGIGAVAGSLLGALVGLGIPEERARVYDERVKRGHYLVILDGTDTEIARAEAVLHQSGVEEFGIYENPDAKRVTADYVPPTSNMADVGIYNNPDPRNATADYVPPTSNVANSGVAKRAIGVFSHRRDAEAAITELRDAGFPLNTVSIIAKDAKGQGIAGVDVDKNVASGNKADDGVKAGAATGGVVGGLTGLLVGLGTLAIPGIGPVIAGGAAATALASTVAGGAIGAAAGGIVGGLVGLGIPEDKARVYSDRFQRGDYLVIIDGTEAEIRKAEPILNRRGIQEFAIYDGTDLAEHRPGLDRVTHHETPVVNSAPAVVNSDRTNYSTGLHGDDPAVVIIDRRDETL